MPISKPRALDGWWRIVNYQLHIDTDPFARLFVTEHAGLITRTQADREFARYTATDDGKLLLRRLKSGLRGPKTTAEVASRYRAFVSRYLPTPALATARLNGEVERDLLKAAIRSGDAPAVIHAQKSWVIPKTASEALATAQQLTAKGTAARLVDIPCVERGSTEGCSPCRRSSRLSSSVTWSPSLAVVI